MVTSSEPTFPLECEDIRTRRALCERSARLAVLHGLYLTTFRAASGWEDLFILQLENSENIVRMFWSGCEFNASAVLCAVGIRAMDDL